MTRNLASPKPPRGPICVQESGLRYYRPEVGRWVSRDPIAERGAVLLTAIEEATSVDFDPLYEQEALGFLLMANELRASGFDHAAQIAMSFHEWYQINELSWTPAPYLDGHAFLTLAWYASALELSHGPMRRAARFLNNAIWRTTGVLSNYTGIEGTYVYAFNDPANAIDPDGFMGCRPRPPEDRKPKPKPKEPKRPKYPEEPPLWIEWDPEIDFAPWDPNFGKGCLGPNTTPGNGPVPIVGTPAPLPDPWEGEQ